jgi:hypothetical protein
VEPKAVKPRGSECQCAVCELVFTGLSAFETHRRFGCGTPPDQVTNKAGERVLFGRRRAGNRIVWGGPPRDTEDTKWML